MKKTEPSSSKLVPNPDSSPKFGVSTSQLNHVSLIEYSLPLPIKMLEKNLVNLRPEDYARWGAYTLEDLGIIEIDRVIGSSSSFGSAILNRVCTADGTRLNDRWREIASRIIKDSPGTNNPSALMSVVCMLAGAEIYIEGSRHAKEAE